MEKKKNNGKTEKKSSSLVGQEKKISSRGRTFQGKVIRKFPKRVAIEFERTLYVHKFERFLKKTTRLHARLPDAISHEINIGDMIKIQECRPLSKIIHFVVIEKVRTGDKK